MKDEVAIILLNINKEFYSRFGRAFAATRRRIQPGVRRVLERLPDDGVWLDLGCGSGSLALEWLARFRHARYVGLDSSVELLEEARVLIEKSGISREKIAHVAFIQSDLDDPNWTQTLPLTTFAGAFAFAVLHHLPGAEHRLRLLRQVNALIQPGGWFAHSEWQFQHSPKLMARVIDWETVGLDPGELEPGDTLLDWRFALPGQTEQVGLRYVHLFEPTELAQLAESAGFMILDSFQSDGQGGKLGLYQVWQKK